MPALADTLFTLLKRADSDDGGDTSYEQAMSDLGDIVIRDRAPALKQYELGFQLLDRDDENEKAVGVKVFKVGKMWLMVPVFLIKGKIKGTELLYIKNQRIFVPLQEDWIRYILNKQMPEIGKSVSRNLGTLGVSVPDLRQIVRPPTKFAADWSEGKKHVQAEVLPQWAKAVTTDPLSRLTYTLPDFLKEAGQPALIALAAMLEECPRLVEDIERYHGDAVWEAAKVAATKPVPARPHADYQGGDLLESTDPIKTGALQVYTYDKALDSEGDLLADLRYENSPELRKGPLIRDTRTGEQVSVAYEQNADRQFQTPTETGIYDVLVQPNKYEKCLVVYQPKTTSGHVQTATLVRLSDNVYVNTHPSNIWCGRKYEEPEWSEFLDKLPEATSIPKAPEEYDSSESSTYEIILGKTGDATAPLCANSVIGKADGGTSYRIEFDISREDMAPPFRGATHMLNREARNDYRSMLNLGTGRGSKIWIAESTMYVPNGYKKLTVTRPKYDESPFQLVSPLHATMGLVSKLPELKVAYHRDDVLINGQPMPEKTALVHLVVTHGLREVAAREILEKAAAKRWTQYPAYGCWIKYGGPYMTESQPGAPPFPDPYTTTESTLTGAVPGMPWQSYQLPVTDMRPDPSNLAKHDIRVPPPNLLNEVQDAAQSGQKEVFDTSMIGSLLNTTQSDLQVDRFLGPMLSGLDAIGQILMSFYWHDKDFADRYGKDDLVSLEDMLKNTFINLGKLILNLKQKGVSDPLDAQRDLDLSAASDQ